MLRPSTLSLSSHEEFEAQEEKLMMMMMMMMMHRYSSLWRY
jgi:hypothetical protein